MFPILVGHSHALELAIDGTLSAVYTAVHVIFQDKPFGCPVQRDQFDGFGRAILGTQTTPGAGGGIVEKLPAITVWCGVSFEWI